MDITFENPDMATLQEYRRLSKQIFNDNSIPNAQNSLQLCLKFSDQNKLCSEHLINDKTHFKLDDSQLGKRKNISNQVSKFSDFNRKSHKTLMIDSDSEEEIIQKKIKNQAIKTIK